MNKFDYEETGYTKPTVEEEFRIFTEEFLVKNVLGKKVLMTTGREFNDLYKNLPEGIHYFAIRGCDADPNQPATIEDKVIVNRCGSMLAKEDLISKERTTCDPKDIYRELSEEERKEMYDMLWDCENQHDAPEDQEFMTISDFIHEDDEEFEVCIEEIVHHTVKVRAKDEEEATIIAAKKYIFDSDNKLFDTCTDGSIDDILISTKYNSGPSAGEYAEFKDLYSYARDKNDGKPVI